MRLRALCTTTIVAAAALNVQTALLADIPWTPSVGPVLWEKPDYYNYTGQDGLAHIPFDVWGVYVSIDGVGGLQFKVDWNLTLKDYTSLPGFPIVPGGVISIVDSDLAANQSVTLDPDGHWQHNAHGTESGTLSGTVQHEAAGHYFAVVHEDIAAKLLANNQTRTAATSPDPDAEYEVIRP